MSEPASRPTALRPGAIGAASILLWLLGSFALLLPPLRAWLKVPARERLALPVTPVDRTLGRYAEEWLFLTRARAWIPEGASLTVRAADPQREVSLYILSLGLFPDARPIPGRYYDPPEEHRKRTAEFVLSLHCEPPVGEGLRQIAAFDQGCVFRRGAAR